MIDKSDFFFQMEYAGITVYDQKNLNVSVFFSYFLCFFLRVERTSLKNGLQETDNGGIISAKKTTTSSPWKFRYRRVL